MDHQGRVETVSGSGEGHTKADRYARWAVQALEEMVASEHAVVWPEVEAKAADRAWGQVGGHIDPHHLTNARHQLTSRGVIDSEIRATRGGRSIEVLMSPSGPKRAVQAAAARKRLLHARYLGWAMGTKRYGGGFVGPGGEAVVHQSLLAAASSGYRVFEPERGEVRRLFDEPVPGGPLDNGALLQLVDDHGFPTGTVVVPIEVKNLRDWIYPEAPELHQLLSKAAQLQRAHPDLPFAPVLVCRKAQHTTFRMAKALGFYVVDLRRQFLLPASDLTESRVGEVRKELGYDLEVQAGSFPLLVRHFTTYLPSVATRTAQRWARNGPALEQLFTALRTERSQRAELMDLLRRQVAELAGEDEASGGW